MSKILVTGATGFIGRWLVDHLLKKGEEVIAHGSSKNTINKLREDLEKSNWSLEKLEFWEQDFLKQVWNFPFFSEIDFIIHCAGATKVRDGTFDNYDKYFELNVNATKKLAKRAYESKIKHFVHLSTGQIYGIPPFFPINDETPKNPINIYGSTKYIGEKVIESFGMLGLNYTIVRPFSVYGGGQFNIISIITDKIKTGEEVTIFGDGEQSRVFTHVNDICQAVEKIINNKNCFSDDINITGTEEYSVNQLVQLISKSLKKEPKIIFKEGNVNELKRNIADISKLKKIGFEQKENLRDYIANNL